jgi:RimJ/RimL family protein N-acetyltransferase
MRFREDGFAALQTDRLILRRWRESDRPPFAALNADPEVMRYFMKPLTRAESDTFVDRIEHHFQEHDWGLWALERRDTEEFIGFTGLWPATFEAQFTPAVEVGWRLRRSAWGYGFASEAAKAAIADGFDRVRIPEILSFTATVNERSWRVMERLGMHRVEGGDFQHPWVPVGHPVRPHVLYRFPPP